MSIMSIPLETAVNQKPDVMSDILSLLASGRLGSVLATGVPAAWTHAFDPCDYIIACPDHGGLSDNGGSSGLPGLTDCPACQRATITENLSRALLAKALAEKCAEHSVGVPAAWHQAADDLHLWDDLLTQLDGGYSEDELPAPPNSCSA